jgi:predicted dehydrogenase
VPPEHYRVAVVGCGRIGVLFEAEPEREKPASHAGAVRANTKTKLVAFVDASVSALARARKMFPGVAGYTTLSTCIEQEQPDLVIIATPASERRSLIDRLARAGVQMVICEKPLAANAREAASIETLVARSGVTFVLNYQRRFSPLFARVRRHIKQGKWGRIQQVTGAYSNGLFTNGGHLVDAVSYLLDDQIVWAIGLRNEYNATHPKGDLNVEALLMTRNRIPITIQSFDQKEYGIHDLRIYGTKGSIVFTDYGATLVETRARSSRYVGIKQLDHSRQRSHYRPIGATQGALEHVIACYEECRPTASSAATGTSTMRVLDAIAKSARHDGKKILV